MAPYVLLGALELILASILLGLVIRKPPVEQPPQVFIGRVLMPVSMLFIGVSIIIQPSSVQTALPSIIGFILAITALFLQLRYRPAYNNKQ